MSPTSLPTPDPESAGNSEPQPPRNTREFYGSKAQLVGFLLLALLMVCGAFYVLMSPGFRQKVIGFAGLIFFGLSLFLIARYTIASGPLLVLSEKGIEDRRLGCGLIPWEQVIAVSEEWFGRQQFLCVRVANPEQYLRKMPYHMQFFARGNQAIGYSAITISFNGLDGTIDEALPFISFQLTRVQLARGDHR